MPSFVHDIMRLFFAVMLHRSVAGLFLITTRFEGSSLNSIYLFAKKRIYIKLLSKECVALEGK
jgi:hypothetical protein